MWKVIAAIAVLLAMTGGIIGACVKIYDAGGDARQDKIKLEASTAQNKELERAQAEIVALMAENQEYLDEILNTPPADMRPSDPLIKRHYERVRRDRKAAAKR